MRTAFMRSAGLTAAAAAFSSAAASAGVGVERSVLHGAIRLTQALYDDAVDFRPLHQTQRVHGRNANLARADYQVGSHCIEGAGRPGVGDGPEHVTLISRR